MTEDEMVGWHHQLNGYVFEQTLEVSEGQGNLACCSPWGHKELDTTQRLNKGNPWNLCMVPYVIKEHLEMSLSYDSQGGNIILDYLDGPNSITSTLRGRQKFTVYTEEKTI